MKLKKLGFIISLFFLSMASHASSCNFSYKEAVVSLSLENNINIKITSKESCKTKEFMADRFFDADVEVYKANILLGKFYSRHLVYNPHEGKLLLKNANLLKWIEKSEKIKKSLSSSLLVFDAKKKVFMGDKGSVRI